MIGASDSEGSVGQLAWKSVSSTPDRQVVPVNPRHDTIDGRRAYASVADVPHEIGLAIIAVPLEALEATIQQCIDERVRGAVVITAVPDGSLDIDAIVANARRNGLRIIGPSSFGIASPRPETELQAALVDVDVPAGHVAVSMQSGTLATSLLLLAQRLGVGLSWFVSLGDKADLSANDLLQFWEDDEATKVIALYTESLGNPRKFARIARRVAATKPIVVVRTGAALVGTANAALYEQTGVIQVPTVAALLDTARVFATQPLMAGERVAVISNAKSPFVLTAATLDATGLEVAAIAEPRLAHDTGRLRRRAANGARGRRRRRGHRDPRAAHVLRGRRSDRRDRRRRRRFVETGRGGHAGNGGRAAGARVPDPDVLVPGTGRGGAESACCVLRLAAHGGLRGVRHRIHPDRPGGSRGDRGAPPRRRAKCLPSRSPICSPVTASRCRSRDWSTPRTPCRPPTRSGTRSRSRRSDGGSGRSVEAGIALDLSDDGDVEEIVGLMIEHLGDDAERVYVQRMVPPGADLRIRVTHDERIGPVVTVGIGGLQADAIGDESSRLAPVSSATALSMVSATRAAALLDEAELHEVADQVTRVAQLASDHAEIAELDLNPVIVSDEGCWVADARIVLRRDERRGTVLRRLD